MNCPQPLQEEELAELSESVVGLRALASGSRGIPAPLEILHRAAMAGIKRTSKPQTSYTPVGLRRNKTLKHSWYGFLGNIHNNNSVILWVSVFLTLQAIN